MNVYVAGIDEAGHGPLLGPLALGYAVLRVAVDESGDEAHLAPWSALAAVVSREPRHDRTHLIVADSKLVYAHNRRGEARLERTALAFLDQLDAAGAPRDGRALALAPPERARCAAPIYQRDPWYERLGAALPRTVTEGDLRAASARLRAALAASGTAVVCAGSALHTAAELNASWRLTGNKGLTLWRKTAALVEHLFERCGGDPRAPLQLTIDRHGGRKRYEPLLRESFPLCHVEVLSESEGDSRYRMRSAERGMELRFVERGEERSFAVALASCLAKYAREISMKAFNEFFAALQPDLLPTAGYVQDGRRWIAAARPALERAGVPAEVLIRER